MKKFKIEVNYTLTAYVEVEANTEEEAINEAYEESGRMEVRELKEWSSNTEVKSVTEQCQNCCKEVEVDDVVPVIKYRGVKLCDECVDWAKQEPKDFEFIFKGMITD